MASSTQKKTTTKKSGSRSGSRTAKGKQPQKRPIRREVGGVILLVLALCVLVSYCGVQAILIDLLAKLLKGLFGYGYWLAGSLLGAAVGWFLYAASVSRFFRWTAEKIGNYRRKKETDNG